MPLPNIITSVHQYLIDKGIPSKLDAAIILGSRLGDFGANIQHSIIIPGIVNKVYLIDYSFLA